MSDWIPQEEFSDSPASMEALLRMAGDDVPSIRRGLKAETITQAQKAQREIRLQHFLWGAATAVMLFAGGLMWWPTSGGSPIAANEESSPKPGLATSNAAFDAVWNAPIFCTTRHESWGSEIEAGFSDRLR